MLLGNGSVRAQFRFAATTESKEDRNVVGIFSGSDPEKKKEIVIYSAHYDHVGVNENGEIFNGADDNASGTSTLLEIAQAFGKGPRPARSVAFLWVSGEEKGLLGSNWFADHMNLPGDYKIVADINLDMVSRNDPNKVGVTPSPKHGEYNSLVPAARLTCRTEGMEVVFDADEYYGRTDSYSFAALLPGGSRASSSSRASTLTITARLTTLRKQTWRKPLVSPAPHIAWAGMLPRTERPRTRSKRIRNSVATPRSQASDRS
jgi:hypothetical protein